MKIIYSDQKIPRQLQSRSLFLAGPTPRDLITPSWRPQAISILKKLKYGGTVYVPERRVRVAHINYDDQVEWEDLALNKCFQIFFWIPRNLTTMIGLTTNVEFGRFHNLTTCYYGRPNDAERCRYLDWLYTKYNKCSPIYTDLEKMLETEVL